MPTQPKIYLQIMRGLKASMPTAFPAGVLFYCTDTTEIFVGTGTGHVIGSANATLLNGIAMFPQAPVAGQILIFDQATGTYVPGDPIVSGPDAPGVDPTRNPVQVGGVSADGKVRRMGVDTDGNAAAISRSKIIEDAGSVVPLASGDEFESDAFSTDGMSSIIIYAISDKTLLVQVYFSNDGTNWDSYEEFLGTPTQGFEGAATVRGKFFKIEATNFGPDDASYMRLQVTLSPVSVAQSVGNIRQTGTEAPINAALMGATSEDDASIQSLAITAEGNLKTQSRAEYTIGELANNQVVIKLGANKSSTGAVVGLNTEDDGSLWVAVKNSALPAGAATAALQGTAISGLAAIVAALSATLNVNVQNTVPISLTSETTVGSPIPPKGLNLIGEDRDGNAINLKSTQSPGALDVSAFLASQFSGDRVAATWTSATALNADVQAVGLCSGFSFQLNQNGGTISGGAAVVFEISNDGDNWVSVAAVDRATGLTATSYVLQQNTKKIFDLSTNAGVARMRLSVVITGTLSVGAIANSIPVAAPGLVAISNFPTTQAVTATLAPETTKVIGTVNISAGQTVGLAAGSAVIGHVISDSGSVVAATLSAETTKIIGTVNISASQAVTANAGTNLNTSLLALESGGNLATLATAVGALAATAPTKASYIGGRGTTGLPAAVTDGQQVGLLTDKFGRNVSVLNTVRDLVGTAMLNSSSSSLVSFIASGGTGVFTDIISFIATNESATATIVSLSDGTTTYKFALAANGGIVAQFPTPLPAASSATAWQVLNSAGVAVDYVAVYAKNK